MGSEAYDLVRCFKVDRDLDNLIEWMAKQKQTSKSGIIRRAIIEYYRQNFTNTKPFKSQRITIY